MQPDPCCAVTPSSWALSACRRLAALAAAIDGVLAAAAALRVLVAPAEEGPVEATLLQEAASAMPSCLDSLNTLRGCLNIPAHQPQVPQQWLSLPLKSHLAVQPFSLCGTLWGVGLSVV